MALELMLLGHKPSKKWKDSDQDVAEHRLNDFSRRVIDLEQLSLHSKRSSKGEQDFDVYLLRSIKKGGDFLDEVVAVDNKIAKSIKETREEIAKVLDQLPDKELKLATIAELVDEFLGDYRKAQKSPNVKKKTSKPEVKKAEDIHQILMNLEK